LLARPDRCSSSNPSCSSYASKCARHITSDEALRVQFLISLRNRNRTVMNLLFWGRGFGSECYGNSLW
jgi:hypothetical protein